MLSELYRIPPGKGGSIWPAPAASNMPRDEVVFESPHRTLFELPLGATNCTHSGASEDGSATAALVPEMVASVVSWACPNSKAVNKSSKIPRLRCRMGE